MFTTSLIFLLSIAVLSHGAHQQQQHPAGNQQNAGQILSSASHSPDRAANSAVNTAAEQTKQVISGSRTGQTVRQCSCAEQDQCLQHIRTDLNACFQSCWEQQEQHIGKIAPKTGALKECFESRGQLLDQFVSCINSTSQNSCLPDKNGPQIPQASLQKIVQAGEQRMLSQAHSVERTLGQKNKPIVQTAIDLGTCMKECFMHKDNGQFCFDRLGCQPKLAEEEVGPVLKQCTRAMGWKREASELCDCFLDAGVNSVKGYCQLLRSSQASKKKGQHVQQKEQPEQMQ